ncbi:MAG: ribosomal protein S18-alanine N-acetyltransferase [Cyanobacteria bacterium J06623_7]
MKKIAIKLATAGDIAGVVTLDQICLGGLWQAEAYLREIDSDKSTLLCLYFTSEEFQADTEIIGMACLWSIVDEAHITLLAVHPNYRRRGLGQLLLFELLADAIARQLTRCTLEVNENNLAAVNLYQKYGFQTAGKRKNYYQPAGDDALVLWLKNIQHHEFKHRLAQEQQQLEERLSKNSYCLKRE